MRMQVACDTPLGVEFVILESKGTGSVIVVERLVEKFAEARGWKVEECELINVIDQTAGREIWPLPDEPPRAAVSQARPE